MKDKEFWIKLATDFAVIFVACYLAIALYFKIKEGPKVAPPVLPPSISSEQSRSRVDQNTPPPLPPSSVSYEPSRPLGYQGAAVPVSKGNRYPSSRSSSRY